MEFTHLKLDKFVAGNQKRLFQSDIHKYTEGINSSQTEIDKNIYHETSSVVEDKQNQNIFYGKFSQDYKVQILNQQDSFYTSLLNFNSVAEKYVGQKNKINVSENIAANRYYKNLFQSYNFADNQTIKYFQSIIDQPIDIIGIADTAYLLSPLKNASNVQMFSQQQMLNLRDFNIQADYKENYNALFKYMLNRNVTIPQKNSIPLYDMNFTNLQTITFNSLSSLNNFLQKYKFDQLYYNNMIASSYITCNVNGKFEKYDSIHLQHLLQIISLTTNTFKFSNATKRQIFKDLVDNIQQTSLNSYVSVIGNISKLSDNTKANILNSDIISSTFYLDNNEIYRSLKNNLKDSYYINNIPKNSLYIIETLNPLQFGQTDSQKPSAYMNFVNLKNMQTPLQDYDVTIKQIFSDYADFYIKGNKDQNINENITSPNIYNKEIVKLYDVDRTKSYQFNENGKFDTVYKGGDGLKNNFIPTKSTTEQILQQATKRDLQLSYDNTLGQEYNLIGQDRINSKTKNYLNGFYQRHIQDNKQYQIGQLNGLRSYMKGGILQNENNIWLAYKYITSKNQNLIDSYASSYILPFKNYQVDRQGNMEKDYIGILYSGVNSVRETKACNTYCPFRNQGISLKEIPSELSCFQNNTIKCEATDADTCEGYCSFPWKNQYLRKLNALTIFPSSISWNIGGYKQQHTADGKQFSKFNLKNKEFLYFKTQSEANYQTNLYAQTDLNVSDDLQIYFSNMEYQEFVDYINENGPFYNSIFRGFGRDISGNYYNDYLLRNNEQTVTQDVTYKVEISSCFKSIREYANQYLLSTDRIALDSLFERPLRYFINQNYVNAIQNNKSVAKALNVKLKTILKYNINSHLSGFNKISFASLKYGTGVVKQVQSLSQVSYHLLYENDLFQYIKELYLYDTTNSSDNIKLKDLEDLQILYKTRKLYNGFVIADKTPFNGPHTIQKGTKLYGLYLNKKQDDSVQKTIIQDIPADIYCYIRVVNWWSSSIKCTGTVCLKYNSDNIDYTFLTNYTKILNTLNNFDFIEKVDGFFKAQQTDYKKSNIYSIKVTNSGFNPQNDIISSNYSIYILPKNYMDLKDNQKEFYEFLSFNDFSNSLQNQMKENYLNQQTIIDTLYNYNKSLQENGVQDFVIYYQQDVQNKVLNYYKFYDSYTYSYIQGQDGIYKLNTTKLNKMIKAKQDLRQIFESAIKDSVKKYMPVHTDLWKIIYAGK